MVRVTALVTLGALLLLGASCSGSQRGRPDRTESRRLDGIWQVEYSIALPVSPGHTPRSREIRGEMALLSDSSLDGAPGLGGRATLAGVYTDPFGAFGFEVHGRGEVPELAARFAPGDSLQIALQPRAGSPVRMEGVLQGDSITGWWTYYHAHGASASGRFVMRRLGTGSAGAGRR